MSTALLRPAALSDAPAITELLNEIDRMEIGRPETDLHEVEADLKHPDTDLEHDSWVAVDDGRTVAYGLLWDSSGGERIGIDHYVLPDHQHTGLRLLEAMEARALAKARANGADRAVVHLHLNARPTTDTALLTARGWRTVRRHHVLHRAVDPQADLPPVPPPGVRLRACADEADRLRVHELYHSAFAEHFGFQPREYGRWLTDIGGDRVDWSLVWIAETDDLGDAGFLLARDDREAMGGSATSASCPAPAAEASAASSCATPSPGSPNAAGTRWASASTPRTPPAHRVCTAATAWPSTSPSTPGRLCSPDRAGAPGRTVGEVGAAGDHRDGATGGQTVT